MKQALIFLLFIFLLGCTEKKPSESAYLPGVFPSSSLSQKNGKDNPVNSQQNTTVEQSENPAPVTEYIQGTGLALNTNGFELPQLTQSPDGISLNFNNTDIRAVITTIAGSMLGRSFQIDPSIAGTITLQTSAPVAKDALLLILEDALRLEQVAVLDNGEMLYFIPLSQAPQHIKGIRVNRPRGQGEPGFAVEAVPLRFTTPTEMRKVLEPFAPPGGILRADDERSLLVLAGTSQELALMAQTIRMFDVDWLKGKSFALYKIRFTGADLITEELNQIFQEAAGANAGSVRLVPIPRINTVIGIASDMASLRQVEDWIARLDIPKDDQERKIYVYHVKNNRVEDLAYSIGAILLGEDVSQSSPVQLPTSNAAGPANTQAIIGGDGMRMVPDVVNNALLIYATPLEYRLLEETIVQLDILPKQVLIETTLAEVTLNDELKFGVQWFFENGNSSITLSEAASGVAASQFPGFSYVFDNANGRRVVLNALSSVTDVNVISSPKVMVLNNQSAVIQVGDQVPVTTQSAVSVTDPDAPIVNSVEFRDTGVIMDVTPHVNANGVIILDIAQEVSNVVATTTSGIDSPTIQQRRITSTVILKSGQTIVLGGLIRQTLSQTTSGVPILSKIPLIGNIFRSKDNSERRTELIVLITARVISDLNESQEVLDDLWEQFIVLNAGVANGPGK